ncbi:transcription factor SPT20 homolog [Lutra lutra]|uniref:transcription factor SPT20 homolog n=1 Tax=Lutra lutra TaxID=9657 RepID=UPI001FD12039|nr:transcription factor SPT20 homolog [Lutra lutra]
MQQALERALDRADYVIAGAQQRPPKRKGSSSGEASLYEKLYDIYVEECGREPEAPEELRSNVNLLEKLVRRESLPCLVVNLHRGEGGYSLMLQGQHGAYSETVRLPYEERELLEYLDAEELPPALLDVLEKSEVNLFQCGCVIAQVRDYRQCSGGEPPGYQSRHILLRPTMQTLACDVQSITSDGQEWTQEDKLSLESQLILATAEPLCLDPSVAVACTANRLLYNKQKMNTGPMKRSFRRYSAPSLHRQRELSACPPPPELTVWGSCRKRRERQDRPWYDLKISKAGSCVDTWKRRPCDLAVPSEVDVQKYARGKRPAQRDVSPPGVWAAGEVRDGGACGCEAGHEPRSTELTFPQSPPPNNPPFSGARRPWKEDGWEGQMSPPHPCTDDRSGRGPPESKTAAGGVVPGAELAVPQKASCTVTGSHGSGGLSGLPPGNDPEQPDLAAVRSPVQGEGVGRPPLRIRLPWSSGRSRSGNSFIPWEASSFLKSPSPAPAPKPPSPSQQSPVDVNRGSPLPAATVSAASAPQRSPASRVSAGSQQSSVSVTGVGTLPAAPLSPASSSVRAPATRVPAKAQKSSVEVIRVSVFPAGALPTASSSPRAPATPVMAKSPKSSGKEGPGVSRLPATTQSPASSSQSSPAAQVTASSAGHSLLQVAAGPGCGARALERGSGPGQGPQAGAKAPAGIQPSSLPSGARPPSAVPAAARSPSVRVQFFLKHASGLGPVTLLEVPQDSLLLNTARQPERRLYQLISQEQLQQASTGGAQRPGPQGPSARGAASPERASSAQQAVMLNRAGEGELPQPHAAVSAPLGSGESQRSPEQSGPRPAHTLRPAPASRPPPQPQGPRLRILRGPVAVTTVAAQTAGPPLGPQPASQAKGLSRGERYAGLRQLPGGAQAQEQRREAPASGRTQAKESESGGGESAAGACGRAPPVSPAPSVRRVRAATGSAPVGGAWGSRGRPAAARELLLLLRRLHPRRQGRGGGRGASSADVRDPRGSAATARAAA